MAGEWDEGLVIAEKKVYTCHSETTWDIIPVREE